jgi:hypothetical protein
MVQEKQYLIAKVPGLLHNLVISSHQVAPRSHLVYVPQDTSFVSRELFV